MGRSDPWVDVRTVCTTPPLFFLSPRRGPLASGGGRVDRGRCRSPLFGGPGTPHRQSAATPSRAGGSSPPAAHAAPFPCPAALTPPSLPLSPLSPSPPRQPHTPRPFAPPPHVGEAASPACRPRTRHPSVQPSAGNVTPPPSPPHRLPAQVTRTPPSPSGSAAAAAGGSLDHPRRSGRGGFPPCCAGGVERGLLTPRGHARAAGEVRNCAACPQGAARMSAPRSRGSGGPVGVGDPPAAVRWPLSVWTTPT